MKVRQSKWLADFIWMFLLFVALNGQWKLYSQCRPDSGEHTRWGGNENVVIRQPQPIKNIRGTVVQDTGSEPFGGVLVEVYDHPETLAKNSSPDRVGQKRIAACVTDETGAFAFEVAPGHYEVRFSKSSEWNVTSVLVLVNKSAPGSRKGIVARLLIGQ